MIKFSLGQIVATPNALEALKAAKRSPIDFIRRHVQGDWGDINEEDKQANETALIEGGRIFSSYKINPEQEEAVWVITEADRSSTCVLMPSDY